ncbi:1ba1a22f-0165-45f2-9f33-cf984cfba2c8-CDS [Sclerotinia trifoliorum]|uniref:1ba1a22f-0165-45f2-9f33-cf984cfba2c8-CDS n=1 Tax=Sclerotinia trifoliorum TaxID=28548 RepID=A0A8H2VPR8_9HELO|nr:1ba1a22f-0165-45f2-9f33-cf984cfba2c8-CDS [Sclerotinia trifoliorum]
MIFKCKAFIYVGIAQIRPVSALITEGRNTVLSENNELWQCLGRAREYFPLILVNYHPNATCPTRLITISLLCILDNGKWF